MKKDIKRWLAVLGLTPSLLGGCAAETYDIGETSDEIFGGWPAATGGLSAVMADELVRCTGTLISSRAMLTSSDCVFDTPWYFYNVDGGEFTPVDGEVFVRPPLAILHLDRQADAYLSGASEPVPIVPSSTPPVDHQTITVAGYGDYGEGSCSVPASASGTLKLTTSSIDDVTAGEFVVNDESVGVCRGDDGGPAISSGKLVGVADRGNGTNTSWYSRVDGAWDWLADVGCPNMIDDPGGDDDYCNAGPCTCDSGEGDCDSDAECGGITSCYKDIGPANGLPDYYDLCWAEDQVVSFFSAPSYGGNFQAFPASIWSSTHLTAVGNNQIESVKIPPGLRVKACDEATCASGTYQWFRVRGYPASGNFPTVSYPNKISYLDIRPAATLYERTIFGGEAETYGIGLHTGSALDTHRNDIASLIAGPGVNVRVCANANGTGGCSEFWGDSYSLGTLNDTGEYVHVRPGVTLYRDPDFGGTMRAFAQGSYEATSFAPLVNNGIGSLVTYPGVNVTLCTGAGGTGTCKQYTGSQPNLGEDMNGQVSYVRVDPL